MELVEAGHVTRHECVDHASEMICIIPDIYLNAGGVTVSYFEWTKNISHMRFGRIAKRFEAAREKRSLEAIEEVTGRSFDPDLVQALTKGPDEIDLVRSGLEGTMAEAFEEIIGAMAALPRSAPHLLPSGHREDRAQLRKPRHLPLIGPLSPSATSPTRRTPPKRDTGTRG